MNYSLAMNNKKMDELDKQFDSLIHRVHNLTPQEIELMEKI